MLASPRRGILQLLVSRRNRSLTSTFYYYNSQTHPHVCHQPKHTQTRRSFSTAPAATPLLLPSNMQGHQQQQQHHHEQLPNKSDWSSSQYLKFHNERNQPVIDLLAKIALGPSSVKRIIDLGCGPGNSTAILRHQYPDAILTGMDSSPDMLRKARSTLPDIEFTLAELSPTYRPDNPADLLFSNAVFQWLPDDQRIPIMQNLLSTSTNADRGSSSGNVGDALTPNGVLALQVPDNFDEPSHSAMREIATQPNAPWKDTLATLRPERAPFPSVRELYDALKPLCKRLEIWHTSYYHVLEDAKAIVEWVKGTGLRPFIDPLPEDQRAEFLTRYTARIAELYPPLECDGRVVLKYPRLFVVAVRA